MTPERVVLCWSSGKDSAWALHRLRADPAIEVVALLTTVSSAFDRVAMHGVRTELLRAQADAVGLPLQLVEIPTPCGNADYEARMADALVWAESTGARSMAFGDLFLEDVRAYRETMLADSPLAPRFPLWGEDTAALARAIVGSGVEAYLTCVDPRAMPAELAGRRYDTALLAELPPAVDPCGENGEFHTCVVAGPMFGRPIPVRSGEIVERDGFVFADLVPVASG